MQSVNYWADPDRVIDVLAAAMQHDPVARYFQLDAYDLPNSSVISLQQSNRFFHDLLESVYDAGATFTETRDSGGVSVWCPPNFVWPVDSGPYLSTSMQDYSTVTQAAKRRRLGSSAYWYLFVIGRDPCHIGKSVSSRLILPFIQKAKQDGVPLWLEATSEHSKNVYEALGFQVVEELKIGKGRCDKKGNLVDGGEGVSMWAMIAGHGGKRSGYHI